MFTSNRPDISNELLFHRHDNGVQLSYPHDKKDIPTALRMSDILQLPFNVYFLNTDSVVQIGNNLHASTLGYESIQSAKGKTIFDVSTYECAQRIIANDQEVMRTKQMKIIEEEHMKVDASGWQCLTVKLPWYSANNKIIGVFGCSIVFGSQAIADSLKRIVALGLLNPSILRLSHNHVYLSKRETECLHLIVRGKTAKEIAQKLHLSNRTIEHYIENLKIKMNVSSKSELIEKAIDTFH